jgi:hypothetical protein
VLVLLVICVKRVSDLRVWQGTQLRLLPVSRLLHAAVLQPVTYCHKLHTGMASCVFLAATAFARPCFSSAAAAAAQQQQCSLGSACSLIAVWSYLFSCELFYVAFGNVTLLWFCSTIYVLDTD